MNQTDDWCGENCDIPPKHLLSDFIEMTYLALVILIGTPSNLYILIKLFREIKRTQSDSVKAGFLLLKINLNISDLLILTILAVGKLCWLATYEWNGGDLLCRLFNFMSMLALYISSNIVVCIALDRLRNVVGASKIRRGKSTNTVRWMIAISWLLSILWSVPQLWVWRTLNVYPDYPGGWVQCSDIWSIERFEAQHQESQQMHSELTQNVYNVSHLALVFWGPFLLLIVSYAFIAVRLMQYSIRGPSRKDGAELSAYTASTAPTPRPSVAIPVTNVVENDVLFGQAKNRSTSLLHTPFNLRKSISSECFIDAHGTSGRTSLPIEINAAYCTSRARPSLRMKNPALSSLANDVVPLWQRLFCSRCLRCRSGKMSSGEAPFTTTSLVDSSDRESVSNANSKRRSVLNLPKRFSGSATTIALLQGGRLPTWRRQLRSRVFRTTLLVVVAHVLFWLPYNLYALMKYVNADVYAQMSEHANVFKDLQILITLINPFLYGFSH